MCLLDCMGELAEKIPAARANAVSDPIFALIAAHKELVREAHRLRAKFMAARALAEEKYGKCKFDWPGEAKALDRPLYDRWLRAYYAARIAGKRLARMNPSTLAGVAALADYTRRSYTDEDNEDWVKIALKTVADALAKMSDPGRAAAPAGGPAAIRDRAEREPRNS